MLWGLLFTPMFAFASCGLVYFVICLRAVFGFLNFLVWSGLDLWFDIWYFLYYYGCLLLQLFVSILLPSCLFVV